jgi:hypothetical protein
VRATRRRFDHLALELSLAVGERIPRYRLWLHLHELGCDPEALSRGDVLAFCRGEAPRFLAAQGRLLTPRAQRRLCREVARFDPLRPTPEERLAGYSG